MSEVVFPPRPPGAERLGVAERLAAYLRDVRLELAKVAWPGREEVVKYTVVVLVAVVLLTAVVFGLDAGFAKAVLALFTKS